MGVLKPHALRRGDVIGICAPASPAASDDGLAAGIRYLESLGYRIELAPHLFYKNGYLAGTDEQRASDLHQLFSNPKVKAIFTARGGYGTLRLLHLLNFQTIRRNPKILVGYSDITALELAIFAKTRLVTFSGPMVSVEMAKGLQGEHEEQFWRSLTSTEPLPPVHVRKKPAVYAAGSATGRLLGGNLTMIAAMAGSRFLPAERNAIVLMEEIDERPYRIDRILMQLKRTALIKHARGFVLGAFVDCAPVAGKPSLTLPQVLRDTLGPMDVPVFGHIPYGHLPQLFTLPIGVRVNMDAKQGVVRYVEGAVR